jgi:hypothetical protein
MLPRKHEPPLVPDRDVVVVAILLHVLARVLNAR